MTPSPSYCLPTRTAPTTIGIVALIDDQNVHELIALAKREDLGSGDITAALLDDPTQPATVELTAKAPGVFAGKAIVPAIVSAYDENVGVEWASGVDDGMRIETTPTGLATLRGPLGSILALERVLLNFVQRLSGVATLTRTFVDAVAGTRAAIYDTRKTTPGWRTLEKYAVGCGGGRNHRMGLFDAVLIKDNHLAGVEQRRLAGVVFEMLNRVAAAAGRPKEIEVEAQSPQDAEELFKVVGINVILLDNFTVPQLRQAVTRRDSLGLRDKVALEASGGVTLPTVREIAETGVERISVGALTHSAPALDLSLDRV